MTRVGGANEDTRQQPRLDGVVEPDLGRALLGWTCPVPVAGYERVVLGHGSGGKLSAELLHGVFLPAFRNDVLAALEDQAVCAVGGTRLAFTTDAFVVSPPFFPGGDIGRLAVCGTVNDLAVGGATPLLLSAAFVLEEGLPIVDLKRIVASMRAACEEAHVTLVTGDTKVVDRGKCDKIFITTSGIGTIPEGRSLSISSAQPGDKVLVSGTIGDHGVAIMSVREGISFETLLESDCAPLADLVRSMLECCPSIRCMRDPTRGGVSSALHELAAASGVGVTISESALPVRDEVRGACEILGLDPVYVANEGKLLAVVPGDTAARLLDTMRRHPLGKDAAVIGEITEEHRSIVTIKSSVGGERVVTMLAGEQLPRIC